MNKKIAFFIMLTILLTVPLTAYAQDISKPDDIKKALDVANDELKKNHDFIANDYFLMKNWPPNGPRKDINANLWSERTLFVYGNPYDYKDDAGYHRYLGYSMEGNEFTNVFYPHDDWAGGTLDQRNWIPKPWKKGLTNENDFDRHEEYRKSISLQIHDGLVSFYGEGSSDEYPGPDCYKGVNSDYYGEWYKYVHIMQPPTEWTWGMGRMWHRQSDGDVWYITVPIAPLESGGLPNLLVDNFTPGIEDAQAGQKYTASVEFTNNSKQTLDNIPVAVYNNGYQAQLKDSAGNMVSRIKLHPDQTKTYKFEYTATKGGNTLKAVIDTPPLENVYKETTEEDNIAEITVVPAAPTKPPSNWILTFQAVSQGGENAYGEYLSPKQRPANTAKWTDIVTATLKPSKPNAPRGHITSWSITSAKLKYPKQHEKFAMGSPYQPQGTTTINMSTGGHEATAKFEEDWSMNGINSESGGAAPGVYNPLEDRVMAENPKEYTLTADYSIKFNYEWKERRRSCHTDSDGDRHCRTYYVTKHDSKTINSTASGELLVNGIGSSVRSH